MFYAIIAVLGLIIGSFLNAVIFRLKSGEQFVSGRSQCPACGHVLGFFDLIPVFSFVFLKGKCRYCRQPIDWQYPLVELVTAIVFVLGFYRYIGNQSSLISDWPAIFQYSTYLIFSCFLIIIFVYDLRYYLILDKVSLTALVVAFLLNYLLGRSILNLLVSALLIGGFFFLQFIVSKGQWIGGGDIRLGLVMGAMLGLPIGLVALGLAYVSGAIVGLLLVALKKKCLKSQLPFGAFLSLSAWACLLWGEKILEWYLDRVI